MSLRLAVIGAGIMGSDHARIIAQDLPGATLQVVCDTDERRARSVADCFGAVHVESDPLAVITRKDVDAIVIASPDETHAMLCIASIGAGKPALCEKPLAPSSDACLQVIAAEEAAGQRYLQVGFMRRFDPSYTEMKTALDEGTLGAAIMMHNFHRNVAAPVSFTGQMAITNSAPHEFDAARFILGAEYTSISVFQPRLVDTTHAGAPVFMVLETDAGQLVNIEINNNAAYGYDVRGELVGEKGTVLLNAPIHAVVNRNLQAVQRYAADWRPRFADAYRLQNKAFLHFANTGTASAIAASAWDGYAATRAAEAGVQALAEGRTIPLVPVARPTLYT